MGKVKTNFHISFIFINLDYANLMKNLFTLTVDDSKTQSQLLCNSIANCFFN